MMREDAHYQLNADITGTGPTVILLHGFVGSRRYWRQVTALLQRSCHVIAFDLLGFGESPKPRTIRYTRADQVASLISSLDRLGISVPSVIVGHSMGTLIALSLAIARPDLVRHLILVSVPLFTSREDARARIIYSDMVPAIMVKEPWAHILCELMCAMRPLARLTAPLLTQHLPKEVARDVPLHIWPSYSGSLTHVIEEQHVCRDLQQVCVPITLLHGTQDAVTPKERIQTLMACNQTIEVRFLKATHQLPLEMPEAVAEAVLQSV